MTDIFLSYKKERKNVAKHLANILRIYGYDVWFDYDLIEGKNYEFQLYEKIESAKVVLVLWCTESVEREWVLKEACLAKELNKFLPIKIETCVINKAYRDDHYVDFCGWDASPHGEKIRLLIKSIEAKSSKKSKLNQEALFEHEENWETLGKPSLKKLLLDSKFTRCYKKTEDDRDSEDDDEPSDKDEVLVCLKGIKDHELSPELVILNMTALRKRSEGFEDFEWPVNASKTNDPDGLLAVAKYPITVKEFKTFISKTKFNVGCKLNTYEGTFYKTWEERQNRSYLDPGFSLDDNYPVVGVNLYDARAYTDWLSEITAKKYRLATHKEWYLCLGQYKSQKSASNEDLSQFDPLDGTVSVNSFISEGDLKLYKQDGYLWEWCEDTWSNETQSEHEIPEDFIKGIEKLRIKESGELHCFPLNLPLACQAWKSAAYRVSIIGFRVVREISSSEIINDN